MDKNSAINKSFLSVRLQTIKTAYIPKAIREKYKITTNTKTGKIEISKK